VIGFLPLPHSAQGPPSVERPDARILDHNKPADFVLRSRYRDFECDAQFGRKMSLAQAGSLHHRAKRGTPQHCNRDVLLKRAQSIANCKRAAEKFSHGRFNRAISHAVGDFIYRNNEILVGGRSIYL